MATLKVNKKPAFLSKSLFGDIYRQGWIVIRMLTVKYSGPLGPIPAGTEINWKDIEISLEEELKKDSFVKLHFEIMNLLTELACVKYNLVHPADMANALPGQKTFKDWWEKQAKKYTPEIEYDDLLFGKMRWMEPQYKKDVKGSAK